MAQAGITAVGEFHYVHHGPGGVPYDDPNALGRALIAAAAQAGVRLTLIDACYLHGGIGEPPAGAQLRFSDGDAEAWARRVDELADDESVRIGAAIHSVRAVDPESAAAVAAWSARGDAPLHAHVSEQPAENEACLAAYGRTPTALLADAGALSSRFTAVHATHLTDADVGLLGGAAACCCVCPTTERDLADGIGRHERARRGRGVAVARQRLARGDRPLRGGTRGRARRAARERGARHPLPRRAAARGDGGWARLPGLGRRGPHRPGARADLVAVALDSVRLAGTRPRDALAAVVFAASAADVRHVIVDGGAVVRDGRHVSIDVAARARGVDRGGERVSALVIDDIGLLVTSDPALGEGPLGLVRDAALVVEGERVAAIERAGVAAPTSGSTRAAAA